MIRRSGTVCLLTSNIGLSTLNTQFSRREGVLTHARSQRRARLDGSVNCREVCSMRLVPGGTPSRSARCITHAGSHLDCQLAGFHWLNVGVRAALLRHAHGLGISLVDGLNPKITGVGRRWRLLSVLMCRGPPYVSLAPGPHEHQPKL